MMETIVKNVWQNGPDVYVDQNQTGMMTKIIQLGHRWTAHLMWKITGIQYYQTRVIRKMVKYLKSYHFLNVNTGTYLTHRKPKMTLIEMTIFTHRTAGQDLNLRHLLGNHHQDGLKEWGSRASCLLLQAWKIILTLNITKPSERRWPMITQRRKRPHSWPKNVRPPTPISVDGNERERMPALKENEKKKSEDNGKEIKVYYDPAKRDSNGIIIGCI